MLECVFCKAKKNVETFELLGGAKKSHMTHLCTLYNTDLQSGFCASRKWITAWRKTLRLWRWILVEQREV